jgi:hypothetical protein
MGFSFSLVNECFLAVPRGREGKRRKRFDASPERTAMQAGNCPAVVNDHRAL